MNTRVGSANAGMRRHLDDDHAPRLAQRIAVPRPCRRRRSDSTGPGRWRAGAPRCCARAARLSSLPPLSVTFSFGLLSSVNRSPYRFGAIQAGPEHVAGRQRKPGRDDAVALVVLVRAVARSR